MPIMVFAVVMLAALLHASWNAVVKSGPDKLLTTIMVTTAAAGLSAALIPFLNQPTPSSFPFAAASALFQIVYFLLVARTYQVADMSQTYPLMRGTAPLIVAVVSVFQMHEALSLFAWIGVMAICLGIFIIALGSTLKDRRGIYLALLNALVIAGYTLIDGLGVRKSGALAAGDCRGHWNDRLLRTGVVGDDGRADCGGGRPSRDFNTVCRLDCGPRAPGIPRTSARRFGVHHCGRSRHPATRLIDQADTSGDDV